MIDYSSPEFSAAFPEVLKRYALIEKSLLKITEKQTEETDRHFEEVFKKIKDETYFETSDKYDKIYEKAFFDCIETLYKLNALKDEFLFNE